MSRTENQVIGSRIKQRRLELNMTQGDIANQIGVAVSTIQRYESGSIDRLKLPVIEAIAAVLGVSPDWLMGKTPDSTTSKLQRLKSIEYEIKENLNYLNALKAAEQKYSQSVQKLIALAENSHESNFDVPLEVEDSIASDLDHIIEDLEKVDQEFQSSLDLLNNFLQTKFPLLTNFQKEAFLQRINAINLSVKDSLVHINQPPSSKKKL